MIQFYKDIPGVTEEDIAAVEELKQLKTRFVFGALESTEAFKNREGEADGFVKLLCARMSSLFGITVQPEVYTREDLITGIAQKRIDFTDEFSPAEGRARGYFMTDAIVQRTLKVFSNKNADDINDIVKRRTVRCAFLRDGALYETVRGSWGIAIEPVFVDDRSQVPRLFEEGRIDAYIDDESQAALFRDYDFILGEDYFPLMYSPVCLSAGDNKLSPLIKVMQKYLHSGGAYELSMLYQSGGEAYLSYKLSFFLTREEREYISRHNTSKTAIYFDAESENYPVSFYNTKEREYQGIAIDVLKEISKLSGLRLVVGSRPGITWTQHLANLEHGVTPMAVELLRSRQREGRFLWTDPPYATDHYALLSRGDFPYMDINQVLRARVGLIDGTAYADMFHEWFPHSNNTVSFATREDAFAALENGKIDLLMATQNILLHLTNYLEKPGFKANIIFQRSYPIAFGLNKNEGILQSIISKAQRQIDTASITEAWKRKVFDYNNKRLRDIIPYVLFSLLSLTVAFSAVFLLLIKTRRMSKSLESTVALRTSELAHASRAKSDFLSRMSHEMRTPMNAIIGMSMIAKNTEDPQKMHGCLGQIEASSKHLLGIINDILDFSKIEAGKLALDEREFSLEKNLAFVVSMMLPKAKERDISIELEIGDIEHNLVYTDSLRLNQVLLNLLSNAVKFSPKGGVIRVKVREDSFADERGLFYFAVEDEGIGISEAQAAKLFRPFEQAYAGVTRAYGGTGLGLAIAKNIVEAMGGEINLKSELGKGSLFIFTIRVRARRGVLDESGAGQTPEDAPKVRDFIGKRALIVDDVEINREILLELLKETGLAMDVAENGQEAVEMFDKSAPGYYDIIFMDVQMPVMDGFTATKEIRAAARPDAAKVYIVAMTANVLKEDVQKALEAGMDGHLGKPIVLEDVLNAIERAGGE